MFQLNIDPADSTEALKLDVTAPTMVMVPKIITQYGVRVLRSKGRVMEASLMPSVPQYPKANTPSMTGSAVRTTVRHPARIECI